MKNEGNENKIILGNINCTIDKTEPDGENKTKTIDAVPIMPCQNYPWIMAWRMYVEGRNQIPPSSLATTGPLERVQDKQGLY